MGGFFVSPGAAVGLFFVILIVLVLLLVICLRRRSQNKLFRAASEITPGITRVEFLRRQKAEYAEGRANEERYEAEIRQARAQKRAKRRVDRRDISGPVIEEPLLQGPTRHTHELEVIGRSGIAPYSQEWREQQAELMMERRHMVRQVSVSSMRSQSARAWGEDVEAEMDIGLSRQSEQTTVIPDTIVEVPRRTAPATRRPETTADDVEALPEYTPEVLPAYAVDANINREVHTS